MSLFVIALLGKDIIASRMYHQSDISVMVYVIHGVQSEILPCTNCFFFLSRTLCSGRLAADGAVALVLHVWNFLLVIYTT